MGIHVPTHEINRVLSTIDKDGNGEIDFTEFLILMTNADRFQDTLATNSSTHDSNVDKEEVLLFEALTEFMKKSALKTMDEIVG